MALAGCAHVVVGGLPPRPACAAHRVATVPIRQQAGLLYVPAQVDGRPVNLVLDTGAERTLLTAASVERLGLAFDPRHGSRTWGIGGETASSDAIVHSLVLSGSSGAVALNLPRVTVGRFGLGATHRNAAGILGADVLNRFDIDLDVASGRMTLYRAASCRLAAPPWDVPAVELPGVRVTQDRLLLPIALDGVPAPAILDTGAQRSAVGFKLALRAGVTASALAADPIALARGAAPTTLRVRLHRFRSLQIGPWLARDPRLPILPLPPHVGEALVGEDFLMSRRIWLSFAARQVFVAVPPSRSAQR